MEAWEGVTRILVPVDGSAGSLKALDTAILLARSSGATIDILYVSYFASATDTTLPEAG